MAHLPATASAFLLSIFATVVHVVDRLGWVCFSALDDFQRSGKGRQCVVTKYRNPNDRINGKRRDTYICQLGNAK